MTTTKWLGAVLLFLTWGFVMHGIGLLLHEVGGHGGAASIFACGLGRVDLTYFGHGVAHYAPCERWTWRTQVVADWAGLALTIGTGAIAMALQRRAGLAPIARLLVAMLATAFLLGQLSYATLGAFHDLYDPARTAIALGAHGLHALAWLPPLVLYVVAAAIGARAVIDAFRAHFASRSRLHTLMQLAATLGVAGALYFIAFRIEWELRPDLWMRGVAYEAGRRAAERHEEAPFPIERVLAAIAAVAFVAALARPVSTPTKDLQAAEATVGAATTGAAPREIPRRLVAVVALLALVCFVMITVFGHVWEHIGRQE